MKTFAILLILPALILAKINVDITASDDDSQRLVHVSGRNADLISDLERETFKLTDENLKSAVKSFFGARPDDAFLKSPTPWGDLYVTNEWKQVKRILKPLSAKVLSVSYKPTVVLSQIFNNTGGNPATLDAKIRKDVENTVSSFWARNGEISANSFIKYGLEIKAMAVAGQASFSYASKWGENVQKLQTVTVGSETGVAVNLQPHQAVVAQLFAIKGAMKVEIDYEASLAGSVVVNFAEEYKGHHFWSFDINKVMAAGGLNRSVLSSEVIDIVFYSDSKVIIHDFNTNEVLYSLPLTVF